MINFHEFTDVVNVRTRSLILSKIRNKFVLDSDSSRDTRHLVSEDAGIRGKVLPVRVRSPTPRAP